MDKLIGKEVGVGSHQDEVILIKQYPGVIVRYYDRIPVALNELLEDELHGVLIPAIPAASFVQDLYSGKVKIATPPLNEAGLRMITLKNTHPDLIERFNRGLEKARDKGVYKRLIKKWNLE